MGGAVLQNELKHRLSDSTLSSLQVHSGESVAYALIPFIPTFPEPERDAVRAAFAQSLAVVWRILIVVGAVGLVTSVFMKPVPLPTYKDESWALKETTKAKASNDNGA